MAVVNTTVESGPATFYRGNVLKPKRIKRRCTKKRPQNFLSNVFVMIHDTSDSSYVCMNIQDQRLNLTPLDIAILQAENLPQATGLRQE